MCWSFAGVLVAERRAYEHNCHVFNSDDNISRLGRINLWNSCLLSGTPAPIPLGPPRWHERLSWQGRRSDGRNDKKITGSPHSLATTAEDTQALRRTAWVKAPFCVDYGTNIELVENVFVNYNCTFIDKPEPLWTARQTVRTSQPRLQAQQCNLVERTGNNEFPQKDTACLNASERSDRRTAGERPPTPRTKRP